MARWRFSPTRPSRGSCWLPIAGCCQPRSWRWPALIGLVLACSGAGVNAGVVAWILPAPLALMLYEAAVAGARLAGARAFGWRAGLCAAVGSAWWAVPLLIQSRYGTDFLSFTELPSSVWATPSLSESFRLLGYWPLYLGLGGTPVVGLALVVPVQRAGHRRELSSYRCSPWLACAGPGGGHMRRSSRCLPWVRCLRCRPASRRARRCTTGSRRRTTPSSHSASCAPRTRRPRSSALPSRASRGRPCRHVALKIRTAGLGRRGASP